MNAGDLGSQAIFVEALRNLHEHELTATNQLRAAVFLDDLVAKLSHPLNVLFRVPNPAAVKPALLRG
mgnify:CR=1 FL=1